MEVLVLLVRTANHTVTRDDLIETCWGGRFVSDDAITRVIGKVRAVARGVEPAPFVLETVPKVGFRLVTPFRDMEPHEAAPRRPVTAAATPGARRWTPVSTALLALALLVLAAMAGWTAWQLTRPGTSGGGVAPGEWVDVAGFRPLQDDASVNRLTLVSNEAMHRALTANGLEPTLARGDPDSSTRLRLGGSVYRDGDRYVVDASMEDRASSAVLWSRRFDRPIGDVAGFQETIASHVSDVLRCGQTRALGYPGRIPNRFLAMFLAACSAARDELNPDRYLELARRLVAATPNLSTAHSMHADAAVSVILLGLQTPERTAALRTLARVEAARALRLDPNNGEAYYALAGTYDVTGQWAVKEGYLQRAMQLGWQPANGGYIWLLLQVGRMKEAAAFAARAAAADPFSVNAVERLAWLEAVDGELPGSRKDLGRLALLDPDRAIEAQYRVEFWHEDPQHALAEFRKRGGRYPPPDVRCAEAYLAGGWLTPGAARPGLPEECAYQHPSWRVRMLARSGQVDAAYRLTASAFDELRENTIFLFYPEMKPFRRDPRFMPLARRLRLVDYWLQTNRWPDFCVEPGLPYDCRVAARTAAQGGAS